jgi:hypothetical protein
VEAHYIWFFYSQINVCGFDEWTYGHSKKVHLKIKSTAKVKIFIDGSHKVPLKVPLKLRVLWYG